MTNLQLAAIYFSSAMYVGSVHSSQHKSKEDFDEIVFRNYATGNDECYFKYQCVHGR